MAGIAVLFLLPLLLFSGCSTVAYQPSSQAGIAAPPALAAPAALRKVREALGDAGTGVSRNTGCRYAFKDIHADFTGFSYAQVDICENKRYESAPRPGAYRYRDIQNLTITHWSGTPRGYHTNITPWIYWTDHKLDSAEGFVDGVNALRYYATGADLSDDASKFARFQEEARAWRALPVIPPLPEQVRQFRLLAEDAIRNRNFEGAVDYYEKGLQAAPL
ncbi:MAG: hypothetical protein AB1346_07835, partial [Thermodesulfobacteriota bacterium]